MLQKFIKKIVRAFGIDLTKYSKMSPRNSMFDSYLHLKRLGFNPNIVIDVGVANGTYELYEAFPDSFFVLVEPLKEYENSIKKILSKYNGLIFFEGCW